MTKGGVVHHVKNAYRYTPYETSQWMSLWLACGGIIRHHPTKRSFATEEPVNCIACAAGGLMADVTVRARPSALVHRLENSVVRDGVRYHNTQCGIAIRSLAHVHVGNEEVSCLECVAGSPSRPVHCTRCGAEFGVPIPKHCPHRTP